MFTQEDDRGFELVGINSTFGLLFGCHIIFFIIIFLFLAFQRGKGERKEKGKKFQTTPRKWGYDGNYVYEGHLKIQVQTFDHGGCYFHQKTFSSSCSGQKYQPRWLIFSRLIFFGETSFNLQKLSSLLRLFIGLNIILVLIV
jgi:hypothetical protein